MHDCPACGGYVLPMGSLGNKVWGRCRDCGMDSHGGANESTSDPYRYKADNPHLPVNIAPGYEGALTEHKAKMKKGK